MKILTHTESLAFEAAHQEELWFYEPIERVYTIDCPRDLYHLKGLFNAIFKHPDYVAQSPVKNDKFITFEHNGEYAVLTYDSNCSDFMMYVHASEHKNILKTMLTTYLRKYNENNLVHFPVLPVVEKPAKAKKPKVVKVKSTKKDAEKTTTKKAVKIKATKELSS